MKWEKLGKVIEPNRNLWWMRSHVMVPCAAPVSGDVIRVYFSGRDDLNRSHVGFAEIDLGKPGIANVHPHPVLSPGSLGCFDDNGVTPSWVIDDGGVRFLYYIGWKPRATTRMSVVAGLASSIDGGLSFVRASRAPILPLSNDEPYSILTAPCVIKENGLWRMWYVSGTGWINPDLPTYNIKYAESDDGVSWRRSGLVCIAAESDDETSLARPCVVRDGSLYRMWYSLKKGGRSYRIGYAESEDGMNWVRLDHLSGIDVSSTGWDSEMIEYAFVFRHRDRLWMLYNGNGYGVDGAGLALLSNN